MDGNQTTPEAEEVSPQLAALRAECGTLHNIFAVLGQSHIRACECRKAAELLDYVQARIDVFEGLIKAQIKAEGGDTVEAEDALLNAIEAPVIPNKEASH